MKAMHLLLIHQAFVTPAEIGGTRHFELGRHWIAARHRFTVVASRRSYFTGDFHGEPRTVTEGINIIRVKALAAHGSGFVTRIVAFLGFTVGAFFAALRVGDPDVILGTSPPIFQALAAWSVAALRRRPFVLEIRDLWPEFAIGMGVLRNPLLIAIARKLERFLYARAAHLVVNSPAFVTYLTHERDVPQEKISCVPNGVEAAFFAGAEGMRSQVREEFGLGDRFVVVYAGAMGIANNLQAVVEAAQVLRERDDIVFLLVGEGSEKQRLQAAVRKAGLANVIFAQGQPKERMPAILAAADAGLAVLQDIPMFKTTYPNKVFDYMAAGLPTVVAIDGVIRDVIEAAGGGTFAAPGDPRAIAAAVLRLADDRSTARRMGAAARLHVRQYFDRNQQAREFATILSQIAEGKHVGKVRQATV